MSLHRRNPRRDAGEAAIVDALRLVGVSVRQLSGRGVADLLCGLHGVNHLVEVKARKGRVTSDQQAFTAEWRGGPVQIARSVEDALKLFLLWQEQAGVIPSTRNQEASW